MISLYIYEAKRLFYFILIFIVSIVGYYSGIYEIIYLSIIAILIFVYITNSVPYKILSAFFIIYLGIGLLNISEYRGYISIETIKIYFLCVSAFFFSSSFFIKNNRITLEDEGYDYHSLFLLVIKLHLGVSYIFVLYIYITKGIVIINQDLRFGISTGIAYAIKSSQFIPVYCMVSKSLCNKINLPLITLASILPSFLIGSRSTGLMVLMSMFFFYLISSKNEKSERKFKFMILVGLSIATFLMIGGGFYIRRAFSYDLLTGWELVEEFFNGDHSWYVYLILPFHQGFNETAALTTRIIDYGIINGFTQTSLIIADFDNLLGLSSVSAAQYFGDEIGRLGNGGLTPGLIGGLYLDFKMLTIPMFLIMGFIFTFIIRLSLLDKRWLCIFTILLSQFFHLFHRGFIKPEYVTIIIIGFFYMLFFKKKVK